MNTGYLAPLLPLKDAGEIPASLALRMRVRLNAARLDDLLAQGTDPESTKELALRARQLAGQSKRERIARSIDGLLALVDRSSSVRLPETLAPISRSRISPSRAEFELLAEKLRGNGPHAIRGLAMANLLIEDHRGALYAHELSGVRLKPVVEAILRALEPAAQPVA